MTAPKSLVVMRKTLADLATPKALLLFLVPYAGLTAFISMAITNDVAADLAMAPLRVQEVALTDAFSGVAFVWAAGIPMMALVGVQAARAVASEAERGTLGILLSKPIRRREILLGKVAAIVLFSAVAMLAGLAIAAVAVYYFAGASAAAIGGGIFSVFPGHFAYAIYVALVLGAVGTFFAVLTRRRMWTALASLVVPALFFAFVFVRSVAGPLYEQYMLYVVDVSYHFGNAFVFVHGLTGTAFSPTTQVSLDTYTGVYDTAGTGMDPLVGGMSSSVPLAGYVPPAVSFVVLLGLSLGLLAAALYRFDRADIQ